MTDVIRQFPQMLKRYLTFAPRNVVYTARVDGAPDLDPDSGGVISFHVKDDVGDPVDVLLDYTIDIGTSAGGHDVGQFRVRDADLGASILYTNETAFSSVPVANDHYVTIIAEHKIWQRRIRRVPALDGLSYAEYFDYDVAYGHENAQFYVPVGNITKNADGDPYLPAGFYDKGHSYRTVDLCCALSESQVNPITLFSWNIKDATLISGTLNSDTIRIRIPAGYREIRLGINTAYGVSWRYVSLWAFDPDDPDHQPITDFTVTSDQRSEGHEKSFEVRSLIDLSIYPEGTLICYWEQATFGDDPAPDNYITSFLGWALQNVTKLRFYRSIYTIKAGGPQAILNAMYGFAQTVFDPRGDDTLFVHMPNNTPDKMIHYFLRIYTTAMYVMNLYFSDYQPPIEGYTSDNGSVWSQIASVAKRYFGVAACDSVGSLYLRRHRDYLTDAERALAPPIAAITKSDWTDAEALELTEEETEKYGLVDLYGSSYEIVDGVDHSHVWRVWAPGLVQGTGTQQDTGLPDIFLRTTTLAESQLKRLAGYHLARLNNPRPDNSLPLLGNMDIFEVAWGLPITITYTDDNIRGTVLNAQEFLIKSISVNHSNKPPFKKIALSIEQVTSGRSGITIADVIQRDDVEDPLPPPVGLRLPLYTVDTLPTELIIMDSGGPHCHVALSWIPSLSTLIYTDVSAGLTGYNIWLTADPYHYARYFALQSTGLYRNDDPFNGGTWTLVANNATLFGDSSYIGKDIQGSINRRGYFAILSHAVYVYTTDYGLTWHRVSIIPGADLSDPSLWQTDLSEPAWSFQISPYNNPDAAGQGWIYVAVATTTNNYKSEDWGATWTLLPAWDNDFINGVEIPYIRSDGVAPNINDSQQEWYSGRSWGGGGNSTVWMITKTAGLTNQDQLNVAHSGVQMKMALVHAGHSSFQTFTWDGRSVSMAGNWGGSMSGGSSNDALTSEVTPTNFDGAVDGDYTHVNRYPTHKKASLWWNSQSLNIVWTDDDCLTFGGAPAPAGYTGVGNVQWSLRNVVADPEE